MSGADQSEGASQAAPPGPAVSAFLAMGHFFFRRRNALFPLVFALVFLLVRPARFLGSAELDRWVVAAGIVVALLGQGLRLLVIGYAYIRRGGKDGRVHADDLVVEGIYAHSRNPMYAGNLMLAVGISLVFGSPWMYFVVIPFFLIVYLSITAVEERYLLGKFGDQYRDYVRRVNRFLPNPVGLRRTLSGSPFDWHKAITKEYGTAFATGVGLVAILMWKAIWLDGFEARRPFVLSLSLLFVPLVAFYAFARWMKHSDRIKPPAAA
jgi:protein-S-isoprenylcysteine O-methyltransferase Ste14